MPLVTPINQKLGSKAKKKKVIMRHSKSTAQNRFRETGKESLMLFRLKTSVFENFNEKKNTRNKITAVKAHFFCLDCSLPATPHSPGFEDISTLEWKKQNITVRLQNNEKLLNQRHRKTVKRMKMFLIQKNISSSWGLPTKEKW